MFPRLGRALKLQPEKTGVFNFKYAFSFIPIGDKRNKYLLIQSCLVFRPVLTISLNTEKNASTNSCFELLTYFITTASVAIA